MTTFQQSELLLLLQKRNGSAVTDTFYSVNERTNEHTNG